MRILVAFDKKRDKFMENQGLDILRYKIII